MMMGMKVRIHLWGGPHDGAMTEIDAPAPKVLNAFLNGVIAQYHYQGTENSVAMYGIEPLADAPSSTRRHVTA